MSPHPLDLFRTSCGATAPLELNISGPGQPSGERRIFEAPFVLIGRHERSCLRLEGRGVSWRHAYLQQLGGRVFCVDLGSRTGIRWGEESRLAGWLLPEQGVRIGPYTLKLPMAAQAGGGAGEGSVGGDPLQDRADDSELLPRITVELGNEPPSSLRMNRVLVLVGSSPACRVRLRNAGVAEYHCSLVRTPAGVWVVDLLSGTGTGVNGQPIRWALLKEGDRLQVGPYAIRIGYPDVRTEMPLSKPATEQNARSSPSPLPEPPTTELSVRVSALQAALDQALERQRDAEALRQQLADRQTECDRLREQTGALECQVAEMAGLRTQLEDTQSRAGELEVVRAERDQWQAQTQALQDRLAAEAAEREEWRQQLEEAQQQLVEERESVCAVIARLEQESAILRGVRADLATQNAEYAATLQQMQEIRNKLACSQEEARSLRIERDQALERQRDVEALKQRLADGHAEHAQLRARLLELEGRATSADHLAARLRAADVETERLRVQLEAAASQAAELEAVRTECDRLREQMGALGCQVAEMGELRDRLETAEARAAELEVVRAERDQWQAQTQALQDRLASGEAEREQLARLAADLHAIEVERDRLQTEQQASLHAVEQAQARVSDLERILAEATAAHEKTLEEARARWVSERQALEALLQQESQARQEAVQAAVRDVQARFTAEREEWRQRLEGAEVQLVWERKIFRERCEQMGQQAALLQADRDRLAFRVTQVEASLRGTAERSRQESGNTIESDHLRQQAAQEQVFAELAALQLKQLMPQTNLTQDTDQSAEPALLHAPLVPGQDHLEEQRRLNAIAQEIQSAWATEPAPSDIPQGPAIALSLEGEQPAEDRPRSLAPQKSSQPEERQGLWGKILNLVHGK